MHHIPHLWGSTGLCVNMAASILLLWFPPKVAEYTEDGLRIPDGGTFREIPATADGRRSNMRRYRVRRDGFRLEFAMLFLGFFLQLLDLLTT
jgi:hypothetical protein